jgi:hypothetical protein
VGLVGKVFWLQILSISVAIKVKANLIPQPHQQNNSLPYARLMGRIPGGIPSAIEFTQPA